jgi:TetR/AcrR family transcriptional regulator, regulator of cefoperazone and chloramphenicol sensitivity
MGRKSKQPTTTSTPTIPQTTESGEDDAKSRLLQAGLEVFAKCGYDAASTRLLASRAGVNLAAIPYHFGGKEGLYHAVVQMITDRICHHMQPFFERGQRILENPLASKSEILDLLAEMLPGPITLFAGPAARYFGPIIAIEQQQPTAAFSILYEGYVRRAHEMGARLVARYLNLPEDSPEAIIRTHAMAGQMFVFLGARATILRRLGCDRLSEENVHLIQAVLSEQVRGALKGSSLLTCQKKEPQQ